MILVPVTDLLCLRGVMRQEMTLGDWLLALLAGLLSTLPEFAENLLVAWSADL